MNKWKQRKECLRSGFTCKRNMNRYQTESFWLVRCKMNMKRNQTESIWLVCWNETKLTNYFKCNMNMNRNQTESPWLVGWNATKLTDNFTCKWTCSEIIPSPFYVRFRIILKHKDYRNKALSSEADFLFCFVCNLSEYWGIILPTIINSWGNGSVRGDGKYISTFIGVLISTHSSTKREALECNHCQHQHRIEPPQRTLTIIATVLWCAT